MSYKSGNNVLPVELIIEIQKYIDGEYIYIPKKECNRKLWGETNNSRNRNAERNREIYCKYISGTSVKELAEFYYLSDKTIYSIIASLKTK